MIQLNKINKFYKNEAEVLHILKDIQLIIKEREMVAIMGPSGAGKSTLVNILGFIDSSFEGEYLFEGKSLVSTNDSKLSKIRNETVGFVFQNFKLIENNTVYENVELPLLYGGNHPFHTKEKVLSMLARVGLKGKEYKYPKQLSGGQQQRVAIARALINNPKLIIADEPTGALDIQTSEEIMQLFVSLNKEEGVVFIIVTHDSDIVPYCHRIIRIRDGIIIEDKELIK
ncbi:ABC transporter ATP-binding protein [Enterococcus hirae]